MLENLYVSFSGEKRRALGQGLKSNSLQTRCILNFSSFLSVLTQWLITVLSLPNYLAFSPQHCQVNINQLRIFKSGYEMLR